MVGIMHCSRYRMVQPRSSLAVSAPTTFNGAAPILVRQSAGAPPIQQPCARQSMRAATVFPRCLRFEIGFRDPSIVSSTSIDTVAVIPRSLARL